MTNPKHVFRQEGPVEVFAALGDPTRMMLISKLGDGRPQPITSLWIGSLLSRQAVTRHLQVLEDAGLVKQSRKGREVMFMLKPERLEEAKAYLETVQKRYETRRARLRELLGE